MNTQPGELTTIKFKITFVLLLFLLGIIIVFCYWKFPSMKDLIIFSSALVVALTGIYSAFYIAITLKIKMDHDRKRSAFELALAYSSKEMTETRQFMDSVCDPKQISSTEILKKIKKDPKLATSIKSSLNYFECVAIAIRQGLADEIMLKMAIRDALFRVYDTFKPYIEDLQDTKYGSKEIYKELSSLAFRWKVDPSVP